MLLCVVRCNEGSWQTISNLNLMQNILAVDQESLIVG